VESRLDVRAAWSRAERAPRREIVVSLLVLLATLPAVALLLRELGDGARSPAGLAFAAIVAALVYGNLVYQLTRLAYFIRVMRHRPESDAAFDALHRGTAPALTILVPSYKEDPKVVAMTLWSAALQDYPNRHVVLLIDDPPVPGDTASRADLEAARALPRRLAARLARPARHFAAEERRFLARAAGAVFDRRYEAASLAQRYREAAAWFARALRDFPDSDPAAGCFRREVLVRLCDAYDARAGALRARLAADGAPPSRDELAAGHRRLVGQFRVSLGSFERKRYVNLSHEPNKAMNLNSYIGLAGRALRERIAPDGRHLDVVAPADAQFALPHAEFFITLDADSLLRPDYACRLIEIMRRPGNERLAVVQTPYSAFAGASGRLERVAGATTDIQYQIHQGFTGFGATYWVGANALLRAAALDDIAVAGHERGFPVTRYIQDRTVIEDTESSIDLIAQGWRLHNYPERLAYSATPPDFGALIIQRRRWANGGLIILPKLLRYLARAPWRVGEGFMRIHYLASIAMVNVGLLVLLAVPFPEMSRSPWLPASAAGYFLLYARDLVLLGYRAADLLRVYALNLLLIPVNLAGVAKSLQQAWSGAKIPFARTPKIAGRTAAAPGYLLAAGGLALLWLAVAGLDFAAARWAHGAFVATNALFMLYALLRLVGPAEAWSDLRAGLAARARADAASPARAGSIVVPEVTRALAARPRGPLPPVAGGPSALRPEPIAAQRAAFVAEGD
jgi:cellulose synthase (UDP-forming)